MLHGDGLSGPMAGMFSSSPSRVSRDICSSVRQAAWKPLTWNPEEIEQLSLDKYAQLHFKTRRLFLRIGQVLRSSTTNQILLMRRKERVGCAAWAPERQSGMTDRAR